MAHHAPASPPARRSGVCAYGVLCVDGEECTRAHLVVDGRRWTTGALSPATELCQLCWPDALGSGQGLPAVVWPVVKASPDFAQKVAHRHRCPVLSKYRGFARLLETQPDALLDRLDALLLLRQKSYEEVVAALEACGATMDLDVLKYNMRTLHGFALLSSSALMGTVHEAMQRYRALLLPVSAPPPPPPVVSPTTPKPPAKPLVECRLCLDEVTTCFGALRHEDSLCLVACARCMAEHPTPPDRCLRCQQPHLGWQRVTM